MAENSNIDCTNKKDPVKVYRKDITYKTQKRPKRSPDKKQKEEFKPSLSTRLAFLATKSEIDDALIGRRKRSITRFPPGGKIDENIAEDYVRKLEESQPPIDRKRVIPLVRLPSPTVSDKHDDLIGVPRPAPGQGPYVGPCKPSYFSDQVWPDPTSTLTLPEPKSGIRANKDPFDDERLVQSIDLGYDRNYYKRDVARYDDLVEQIDKKRGEIKPGAGPTDDVGGKIDEELGEQGGGEDIVTLEEAELAKFQVNLDAEVNAFEADKLDRKAKRSRRSKHRGSKRIKKKGRGSEEPKYVTADEELLQEEESEEEMKPVQITKWTQKHRRESEAIPKIFVEKEKIKHGSLESHSFTRLDVRYPKQYPFFIRQGNYHQGDEHFPAGSRHKQHIANCIVAYCYAVLKHPTKWESPDIDHILECGDRLYRETLEHAHMHEDLDKLILTPSDYRKPVIVGGYKFLYVIDDPDVIGSTLTADPKVFDIVKGMQVYFKRNSSGLFFTNGVCFAVWRNLFYNVFDPSPRGKDMTVDLKKGTAALLGFTETKHVATFLTQMNAFPVGTYSLSKIIIVKKMNPDEKEEEIPPLIDNNFVALSDLSAILRGSISFSDKCFDVARNKQALPMSVVAIAYSKITPASAWCKDTLDKVVLLGNELYINIANQTNSLELELVNLPKEFLLGENYVQYKIFTDTVKGSLYSRKYVPDLEIGLKYFFDHSTLGIMQFNKYTYAVWKQRDLYYLFDVNPCTGTGIHCPIADGVACLTMHTNTELISSLMLKNYGVDVECPFSIHAVKILKITKKEKDEELPDPLEGRLLEPAVPNAIPRQDSVIEVESNVGSVEQKYVPAINIPTKVPTAALKLTVTEMPKSPCICDLDSPSLSDTQICPPRPSPEYLGIEPETPSTVSLSIAEGKDEGEGDVHEVGVKADISKEVQKEKEDEIVEAAFMKGEDEGGEMDLEINLSQASDLEPLSMAAATLTALRGPPLKEVLPPPKMAPAITYVVPTEFAARKKYEDHKRTQSQQLVLDSNFIDLPDGMQIIHGAISVSDCKEDPEYLAQFVAIAACVVAKKYSIESWNGDVVDYVQQCGLALMKVCPPNLEQPPYHEFKDVALGSEHYSVEISYALSSGWNQTTMEAVIKIGLFSKYNYGIILNPNYACALFIKNGLFYLYDPYPCSRVGLGVGTAIRKNEKKSKDKEYLSTEERGTACFMRFLTVHSLVARMIYNKKKRESADDFATSHYIMCIVKIKRKLDMQPDKQEAPAPKEPIEEGEEAADQEIAAYEEKIVKVEDETKAVKEPKRRKIGYQKEDNELYMIQGTIGLRGKFKVVENCIKECHFACLCAALTLMVLKINKWTSNHVDTVIEQGKHVFSHAKDKEVSEKRVVTNILIDDTFFDVVISLIEVLPETRAIRDPSKRFEFVCHRHNYVLMQSVGNCYLIHQKPTTAHLFDPYKMKDDKAKLTYCGRWMRFESCNDLNEYLKVDLNGFYDSCAFYTFEVTRISKAPKNMTLRAVVNKYEKEQRKFKEMADKPFNEKKCWTQNIIVPWSRILLKAPNGRSRTDPEFKWKEWDAEHVNDLYSLWGTLHQKSSRFSEETRGKQTLANCIVAMLMVRLYEFSAWNPIILDSILLNGDLWFRRCVDALPKSINEFELRHMLPDFTAYPYGAKFTYKPVVQGTMYNENPKIFNLYLALAYFFDKRESRFGIIMCADATVKKRILAFGKIRDSEYFMYDCQKYGYPVFPENQGCSYMLKMNEFNRLLHCIVLTLVDGDFYIYEINLVDICEIADKFNDAKKK